MKKIVFVFIFLGSLVFQSWAQSTDDLDLSTFIHPVDSTAFIRDAGYYNWCNSFIKDDSGTYHLFYSRWPKSLGFTAWLTHSEIAHATASRLEGPYQYQETVLKGRAGFWDAVTAHNVQVRCWNNQYYMYVLVLSLIFINGFLSYGMATSGDVACFIYICRSRCWGSMWFEFHCVHLCLTFNV